MKILVLNGSPRKDGNTSFLVNAFKDSAKNHDVEIVNVATKKIAGCIGCEYCHNGNGDCCQKDDMQEITEKIKNTDMIIFASPIYYWSFSGQLQNCISRFYNLNILKVKKYGLVLSSYSEGVYDAPISQYKSMVSYFSGKDLGIKTFSGANQKTDENAKIMKEFAESIK